MASGIGKTDFSYKIRLNEKPSLALAEWMKKDLFLELWETRPKLVEKKNDETLEITKEVVLDSNNVPLIEKKQRGIVKVNLSDWINKVELKPEEVQAHQKLSVFES